MFKIYREDGRIVIKIFGLTMRLRNPFINRLADCCSIANLEYFKKQNTYFVHPLGIVIAKGVKIGKDCIIFQNVTIGHKKTGEYTNPPEIGNNVTIYANAMIIGDIKIGDNAVIGAGAVVLEDVPEGCIALGNPARITRKTEND
mgnify:CR=1 FL=1